MRKPKPASLPASHLQRIQDLRLEVVSYLNTARTVEGGSNEWLPRDIIGKNAKSLIVWRVADRNYAIDGYAPWHDGMFGGRYADIHGALGWIERAIEVRAGHADSFLGV